MSRKKPTLPPSIDDDDVVVDWGAMGFDEWMASPKLRFVRRPVRFGGHAEPAFRLILQQKWVRHIDFYEEEWRDVPTVNEPDPIPVQAGVVVEAAEKAA